MSVVWNKKDLPTLAEKKIAMINEACQEEIYNGINVELSHGTEHFSLTIHDQTNIESMFTTITLGAKECQYHCDGGEVKSYTAEDIVVLYAAYKNFVSKQTTYCNLLKTWVRREPDKTVLGNIVYGCDLPDDLDSKMRESIEASVKQIQDIVATVNDGAFIDKIVSLENQMTETQMALCDVYEQVIAVMNAQEV